MARNSTTRRRPRKVVKATKPPKPRKPYPGFPLSPHASGHWCKCVNGKLHYFGPWARMKEGKWHCLPSGGWQAALDRFDEEKADLYRDRKPRPKPGNLTVADLCNRFLTSKKLMLDNRELSPRTFADYKRVTDRLVSFFGKKRLVEDLDASDFEALRADIAKTCGLVRLGGEVNQTRMVFKYGFDVGLIDKPVRYGQGFRRPRADVLRKARNGNGPKMFEAAEIRVLLDAAPTQLHAMILLGINCGFGNNDCGRLPKSAIDLEGGWINYPRPKTGISRRCPLWPETVEAIKAVLAQRPTPKAVEDKPLVFVTRLGLCWAKDTATNPISAEFGKLLKRPRCPKCGKIEAVDAKQCGGCKWKPTKAEGWASLHRKGVGFYALRHGFETIGGESRDQVAVDFIMGHAPTAGDMSAVYRERISDERLRAVVDHVHAWLFEKGGQGHE